MSEMSPTSESRRRVEREAAPSSEDDRTVLVGMTRPSTSAELRAFIAREQMRIRLERGLVDTD